MNETFFIKNMVCGRCKLIVGQVFKEYHAPVQQMQLGKVTADVSSENFDKGKLSAALNNYGFELLYDEQQQLIEQMKSLLIEYLDATEKHPKNFSTYLAKELHKDYSSLSRTFKNHEGQTLEKYVIQLKIEKAKELIQMSRLSFSEIAYQLGYQSISHLSRQFKSVTGKTMSHYKGQQQNRRPLDKIM